MDFISDKEQEILYLHELNELFGSNIFEEKSYEVQGIEHSLSFRVFPNNSITRSSSNIIVSNGISIGDVGGKIDVIEGLDNDKGQVIKLSEEYALSTEDIIIIANVSHLPSDNSLLKSSQDDEIPVKRLVEAHTRSGEVYLFNRLRVNHRYESSGASDVWLQTYYADENGLSEWLTSTGADGARLLLSVPKNDIGDLFSIGFNYIYPNSDEIEPRSQNAAFFNIYERDWYSSSKSLGSFCWMGVLSDVTGGNRKYFHEWYAFDPFGQDGGPCSVSQSIAESEVELDVLSTLPYIARTYMFQGSKGEIRIWYN